MESIVKVDKMTINYKSKESIMGRIISTLIICYVAVTYYPLDKITHRHDKVNPIWSASSEPCGAEESGEHPVGAGNRPAPADEESATPHGLP